MEEIRASVRAELRARLVARGAGDDFEDREVFEEVDRLFDRALAHRHPRALLLPARLAEPWRPVLSLDFTGHRRGLLGILIRFAKARVVLPVVRWLYEYSRENFRRQHELGVAMMACLQTLAVEQARLKKRLAEIEARTNRLSS
jgi:hypothetical protein